MTQELIEALSIILDRIEKKLDAMIEQQNGDRS